MTIITDENIHMLVKNYCKQKEKLPEDLKNVPIGKWDISRVRYLAGLFERIPEFNEPLQWDTSNVVTMERMFSGCEKFNQPLRWNVKKVKNMVGMFSGCTEFDQPLKWETDSLETTSNMFSNCVKFNQRLDWKMGKVHNLYGMFLNCKRFNQPLEWDVSQVIQMYMVFKDCLEFNQPLRWNVKNVTNMMYMFHGCEEFDQPLKWETDSLLYTCFMFKGCIKFNQRLDWKMGKVQTISDMFFGCKCFNQPLKWDVSQVEDMSNTFKDCEAFNQPLQWNVSNVDTMQSMFDGCVVFNGALTGVDTPNWDVRKVEDMSRMFKECFAFNQKIEWDTQELANTIAMFMNCEKLNSSIRMNLTRVRDMSFMFSECLQFNQPLDFDVGSATNMENLFQSCVKFNQTLRWDVSNVAKMNQMFAGCERFDSPLMGITEPHWNVSRVYDMTEMFEACHHFNQPLVWDVARVQFMTSMFVSCHRFNQPLLWDVSTVRDFSLMFVNTIGFNQNLTSWEIAEDADTDEMFDGSAIEERNLPPGIDPVEPVEAGPVVKVNAYQIHQFSAKVDIERLNAFFRSKTLLQPETVEDIPEFIQRSMNGLIDQLEQHAVDQEKDKLKEIVELDKLMGENVELELPLSSQTMEKLYTKKKSILGKIHTSKPFTQPVHYMKKIDRLLSMASAKRKEALEREKTLLTELVQVEKEIKRVRMDKNKKEALLVILEERDKRRVLSGRMKLIEYEMKNDREKIVKHRKDLEKIMKKVLTRVNYFLYSPSWRLSILYSLDYVEKQPILFKKSYTEAFLKDCVNAYEGAAGMSCATGVLERFVISLMTACGTVLSVSDNPEYEYIKGIVENGLTKLIPEYILKWYKLHSHDPHRFTTEPREQRLDNLRTYLLSFFPENEELIMKLIPEYAIDVDNDDFAYKKENSVERINMNEVYASSSPKEPKEPKPSMLSRLTSKFVKLVPKKRQTLNAKNVVARLVSNRRTKSEKKRPMPTPRVRTKKAVPVKKFVMGPVIGTAFG
jgi:hypothetical protein